jgi:hypothetical protein
MAEDVVDLVTRAEAVLRMDPGRKADESGPIIRALIEALVAAHPDRNFKADCDGEILHVPPDQNPVVLASVPVRFSGDFSQPALSFVRKVSFQYTGPMSQLFLSVKRQGVLIFYTTLGSVAQGLGSHAPEGCTIEVRP